MVELFAGIITTMRTLNAESDISFGTYTEIVEKFKAEQLFCQHHTEYIAAGYLEVIGKRDYKLTKRGLHAYRKKYK